MSQKAKDPIAQRLAALPEPDLSDPDNPEWTEADFARARPAREVLGDAFMDAWEARRKGGRPKSDAPKQAIKLRLDPDVVEHFRATGPGWQSRINQTLREAMAGPKRLAKPARKTPARQKV